MADAIAAATDWCGQHLPASTPEIIRGAAAEGRLVLALQRLGDERITRQMVARFRTLYPFIEVSSTTGYAIELQPMLLAEVRAGQGLHDHFQISASLNEAAALRDMGALRRFVVSQDATWPEAAKCSGYWYARTRTPVVTISRQDALSGEERQLVRSYTGLGDPRFRGRLGMLDVSATMAAVTADLLMAEAPEVWEGLAANRPQVRATGGPLVAGLLARDYDIAVFGPLGTAVQAARTGAPVEFVCSAPSPRLYGALGAISAVAPHPNAARLWADWSTSGRASGLFARLTGHLSPRIDAGRSWVERQPWYAEDPAQARVVDWAGFAARQAQVVARFRRDIGGG